MTGNSSSSRAVLVGGRPEPADAPTDGPGDPDNVTGAAIETVGIPDNVTGTAIDRPTPIDLHQFGFL